MRPRRKPAETNPATETGQATDADRVVALVSNALEPPPDEGIKKCAQELARVFTQRGMAVYSIAYGAALGERKLLLSRSMLTDLRARRIDTVVYVPTQSATVASLARSSVLRSFLRAKVALVALQPRKLPPTVINLARILGPDVIMTPSPSMFREAERWGSRAAYIPVGVDNERFRPVSVEKKADLRRTYGVTPEERVVLHVGHARRIRGLEWLARLANRLTVLVVIGRSLGFDSEVIDSLRDAGVRVIDDYVPAMHELYQLADVYAFPARNERSAIAAPLSVLEAMACNLPVVSTPFGALPRMLHEEAGLFFAQGQDAFEARVDEALRMPASEVRTREQIVEYTWGASADAILATVDNLD